MIIPPTVKLEEFERCLASCKTPFHRWRRPKWKTIRDLHAQVRAQISEIHITKNESGKKEAERHKRSVVIDIYRLRPGTIDKLNEIRRIRHGVVKPGRWHTLSGDILPDEHLDAAALRCLQEKFNVKEKFEAVQVLSEESIIDALLRAMRKKNGDSYFLAKKFMYEKYEDDDSDYYPGLRTLYQLENYVCVVPAEEFDAVELTRHQKHKTTHYRWGSPDATELNDLRAVRK